jgi:hypothetical protein
MGFLAKWAANTLKDLWQPGQEILGIVNQWARETGECPCCVVLERYDKEATVIGFLAGKKKITQQRKYHGSKL